jgi:hypothetical protein
MIKFKKGYNSVIAFNKEWMCELDDKEVELALHCEISDMFEATGEKEFKEYPYLVSVSIIAANPHESFNELDEKYKPDKFSLIEDCVSYMGGVPVDHKLIETDKLNHDITSKLIAKDAMLVKTTHDFGTVAAQKGRGTVTVYPQFSTEEAAKEWTKELIRLYGNTLMGLVGFVLDAPINMVGDTGWRVVEKQVKGCK